MPKAKVLVPMAGLEVSYKPGDVVDFPDADEFARLVAAEFVQPVADPVDEQPAPSKKK